jgi:hypothetical protein
MMSANIKPACETHLLRVQQVHRVIEAIAPTVNK